jgi:hypothetical protein
MCASPLSPRHAQPDWIGGGLVSRQMMHDAPPSAAISFLKPRQHAFSEEPGCVQVGPVPHRRDSLGLAKELRVDSMNAGGGIAFVPLLQVLDRP